MNDSETQAALRTGPHRATWILGTIIGALLIVIAGATIIATLGQEQADYPPGTPEAAFVEYLDAWTNRDIERALSMFTARARARLPSDDFRHAAEWDDADSATRIWIDERRGTSTRAVLDATIETTYSGGPFGPDRWKEPLTVILVLEDDAWRIDTPLVGMHRW